MRFLLLLLLLTSPALAEGSAGAVRAVAPSLPAATEGRHVSVVVTPGVMRTAQLPTRALRAARRAMVAGEALPETDLRALAEAWDGLAAQRLARLLLERPGADPSDVAYFATIAVSTGRVWTLPDAVAAMRRLDPATEPRERVRAYIAMLYPHAWAGNGVALDAVMDLNGEGRLFGPLSEATRARILEEGGPRAALRLGLAAMASQPGPADIAEARALLGRAAEGGDLAVRATALNLLSLLPEAEG